MLSHGGDASPKEKNEEDDFAGPGSPSLIDGSPHKPLDIAPLEEGEEDEGQVIEDEDNQSNENAANQLVVYNPMANGSGEIETIPETTDYQPPPFPRNLALNPPSRVLPSVGAFTVQCANCFKWRLIPTKEKYEEIRENILQNPFLCETAREWRPEISCDDPADISQDGSRLWAIDKPNISQPPPGWQRLLRIRGEGSTKFADVYYVAPTGKRLRSMVEVQKFLLQHPEYIEEGVTMAQFSFQIPKPLNDNYVRKRPTRVAPSHETGLGKARPLEPAEVNPLSWAGPLDCPDLPIARSGLSTPYFDAPDFDPVISPRPAKKQARRSPSGQKHGKPRNGVYDL